jgi:diacylglycerol kinase family enzyme
LRELAAAIATDAAVPDALAPQHCCAAATLVDADGTSLAPWDWVKIAILLNAKAGGSNRRRSEQQAAEILAGCKARGIEATAHLCAGARLTASAAQLARTGVDAVVAAGGDGTVSAVAAGLASANTDVVLGVIPLGTLNHFAKDLGVPAIDTALDVIAAGNIERVDVGEVNGRVFVNNSSIGLYPEMVVQRDTDQREHNAGKWPAMLRAAFRTLMRFPLLHVAIALADRVFSARTPIVFVGNNEYEQNVLALGTRRRLDRGKLAIYTIRATRRLHMFWVLLRTLVRRGKHDDFEEHTVERADIVTTKRTLKVAIDGEVVRMKPPLTYKSRPGALRVFAPVAEGGSTA